jgi:hypothetical protein
MPALVLTCGGAKNPEVYPEMLRVWKEHPLPKVALGPSLRDLASRGSCGVCDTDLATATGITALDVSDNPNVTTVAPFAGSLRKLVACGYCGIGDSGLASATRLEHLDAANKITTLGTQRGGKFFDGDWLTGLSVE